jgi:uncharacterized membrane protein YagU involved in acid resistance
MNSQFSFSKAVVAGIVATVVMTLFTYMGGMMGIKMNIPEMLGSMFGESLIIGWMMHFMIGIVLAVNYGIIFYSRVNINPLWLRGALFGLLPWLMAQIMVMPMMSLMNDMPFSAGLFSGSVMMAMASMVGHLVYGAVLGVVYKPEPKLLTANI